MKIWFGNSTLRCESRWTASRLVDTIQILSSQIGISPIPWYRHMRNGRMFSFLNVYRAFSAANWWKFRSFRELIFMTLDFYCCLHLDRIFSQWKKKTKNLLVPARAREPTRVHCHSRFLEYTHSHKGITHEAWGMTSTHRREHAENVCVREQYTCGCWW